MGQNLNYNKLIRKYQAFQKENLKVIEPHYRST
jgi:hypothetical protein